MPGIGACEMNLRSALLLAAAVVVTALTGCGESTTTGTTTSATDPTQPGPYGVGVKRITFTKPSVTMPDQQRVLLTEIWYPGPPGNGPTDQHPGGKVDAPFA